MIAKDNGSPQRSSTATIMIDVIDYNDNPPQFVKEEYRSAGEIRGFFFCGGGRQQFVFGG